MRGVITDSDRQSFHTYVKRIETVNLISPISSHLSPQIWFRVGQVQGSEGPLLPSLRHLRILNESYLDHLEIFLAPSLRTVEINTMRVDSTILPFLVNLRDIAPGLEALLLGPCELSPQVVNACPQFKQLTCLELLGVEFSITDAVWEEICSLERLKKFVLQEGRAFSVATSDTEPPMSESDSVTQGLDTLRITGTSQLVERVINSVKSPDLRELSLAFTEITTHRVIVPSTKKKKVSHIILRTVIERWGRTLVSLSIAADTGKTESLPDDISLVNRGLKRLRITGFQIYPLPSVNTHLHDLEILHFSTTIIPLSRLQHIAETCPKLTFLRCTIDLSSTTPKHSDPMSHQLRFLTIVNSFGTVQEERRSDIAAYVDRLFPNLTQIAVDSVASGTSSQHSEWMKVFRIVKLFQVARADERQRFGDRL